METAWIGCAPDNFRKDRPAGMKPEIIVLHTLGGSLADADLRFNRPGTNLSAHYGVGRKGEIHQYVVETDTAFHAGYVVNPAAALVKSRSGTNPNFYTIGIELEGKPEEALTEAQAAASALLIGDITARWKIPLDRNHVIAHGEIRASAKCPGPAVDIDALLAVPAVDRAFTANSMTTVTLLVNVNFRSRPSVAAPIVRVVPEKSTVAVTESVMGDEVNGNSCWYRDKDGSCFWAGATDRPNPRANGQPEDGVATTDTMNRHAPDIDRSSLRLAAEQFYPEKHKKDLIVLHFTAGDDARSAFDTWAANPEHIATAFIVDTDGTIYEVFDPAAWAFHLGIKGSNGRHDKRSIGIEIANVGPLRLATNNPERLNWWPANFGKKFCTINDTDRYVKINFRDEHYFAAFPETQLAAVRDLVSHLCETFSIPKALPPTAKQFVCDLDYFNGFSGVATHANFRLDKWDIGPAFHWDVLEIGSGPG